MREDIHTRRIPLWFHALTAVLLTLALVYPVRVWAADALDVSRYVGVAKCKSCHKKELIGDQHASWLGGPHARAYRTLTNAESQSITERMGIPGPANRADACLTCHSTAFGLSQDRTEFTIALEDGVQCESCHGPGSLYRKKKIMSDLENAQSKGLWDADDLVLCRTCHNERSPTFDPKRYLGHDGGHSAFDYEQAAKAIAHRIPEHVKGNYIELEKKKKRAEKEAKKRAEALAK